MSSGSVNEVQLTPSAVGEVQRMLAHQPPGPELGLRMAVKGGGCSGLSYALNFDKKQEGDNVFEYDGVKVYVDPKSYLYLQGVTLDYIDALEGKGFKFINPGASKTCGCGESFSV